MNCLKNFLIIICEDYFLGKTICMDNLVTSIDSTKKPINQTEAAKPKDTLCSDYVDDRIDFKGYRKDFTAQRNGEMKVFDQNASTCSIWQDKDGNGKYDTQVLMSFNQDKTLSTSPLDESKNDIQSTQQAILDKLKKEARMYNTYKIGIDGQIGNFEQNYKIRGVNDCWLLAGLKAMSLTKDGAKIIQDSISQDENTGNVTVSLNGVNEKYTFTPQEILKAKGHLSNGDDDVVVIEMAVEKHRRKVLEKGTYDRDYEVFNENLDNRAGDGTKNFPLNGGSGNELFFLLSGKQSKYYLANSENFLSKLPNSDLQQRIKTSMIYKMDDMLSLFSNGQNRYAGTVSFRSQIGNMRPEHTYSIRNIENNYVTLIDPNDTAGNVIIPRKDFESNVYYIRACDMSQ